MAVGRALVLVAQVAVSVDLHHGERSVQGLEKAAVHARADCVLATEGDHELAGGRLPRDRLGDFLHRHLRVALQAQRWQRVDAIVQRGLAVVLAVIELDLLRGLDDRGRAAPGATAIADRFLEGHRQDQSRGAVEIAARCLQPKEVVRGSGHANCDSGAMRLIPTSRSEPWP